MSQLEIICKSKNELLERNIKRSELYNYRFWDAFNASKKALQENLYLKAMSASYFVAYFNGRESKEKLKGIFENPFNKELQKENYHAISNLNASQARLALINFCKVY